MERAPFPLEDVGMVGGSAAMRLLDRMISMAAHNVSTVLITGESGTGKELIARAVHRRGGRRARPFVAVNCGALAESLLEAELFGSVRGAFTGSIADRKGLFEAAHGGTLFLDEVGEMSSAMQVRLLRVLQERTVRPVGSLKDVPVDVRVVAATNRDLRAEVAGGRFREDLFYRLAVLEIGSKPLRERPEDIKPLAAKFLAAAQAATEYPDGSAPISIDEDAYHLLEGYAWPGNVRELANLIERFVAGAGADRSNRITARQVRHALVSGTPPPPPQPVVRLGHVALHEGEDFYQFIERLSTQLLATTVETYGGYSRAAARLGLQRTFVYKKLPKNLLASGGTAARTARTP